MSSLSQRLHLGVQQKQILTPGLVQMVTVLQLNRLELKDMIMNEIAENPVLEESADAGEELTPAELQSLLEREGRADPADAAILENTGQREAGAESEPVADGAVPESGMDGAAAPDPVKSETDPFDEIDFGSFFDDYLDP
jgi:RNA polymerase sigma-54 factor